MEVIGKGRFYLFKKDEQSAMMKLGEYLWGPNIEVSAEIKVDEVIQEDEKKFINLGGPTNHFTEVDGNSNGRNYSLVFRLDRGGLGFKKETVHGVYDEEHVRDEKMELGKWYKLRFMQTVDGKGHVVLQGWVNDQSIGMRIDDGTMTQDTSKTEPIVKSGDKDALYYAMLDPKQIWDAGAYSGLYIRLTGTVKTYIKNVTIKEV